MTTGVAAAIANGWLDGVAGWYVSLHSGDPGASGTSNAITGTTAGSRQPSTMNSAASGAISQSSGGSWSSWDGGSTTISHIGVWNTASGGTFEFSGALTAGKAITDGDTFNLTSLDVDITPITA